MSSRSWCNSCSRMANRRSCSERSSMRSRISCSRFSNSRFSRNSSAICCGKSPSARCKASILSSSVRTSAAKRSRCATLVRRSRESLNSCSREVTELRVKTARRIVIKTIPPNVLQMVSSISSRLSPVASRRIRSSSFKGDSLRARYQMELLIFAQGFKTSRYAAIAESI